jgi:hypothetical protein
MDEPEPQRSPGSERKKSNPPSPRKRKEHAPESYKAWGALRRADPIQ